MSAIFDRIDRLQKDLQALLPMKQEDRQRLDEKIRLEFNYNSNHMEGNTLTYGETKLLLIFGETNGKPHDVREIDEMRGHDVAFKLIQEWAADKEKVLTEADIRTLNEIILVQPFYKDAITPDGQNVRRLIQVGQYKKYPNSVLLQNGEMFHYASPAETPMYMGDLIQWYRTEEEKKELHPVALAALFHYKFVCIHPFDDGNGRISRLLMNYGLLKNNLPLVIIKSDAKNDYLNALHLADTGDLEAFINYIGEQLLWSFDIFLKAAKGVSIDELGDLDKKLKVLKQKLNTNSIKLEKNQGSFINAYENSIYPLLKNISITANKFKDFFKSEDEYVAVFDGDSILDERYNIDVISNLYSYTEDLNRIIFIKTLKGIRDTKSEFKINISLDIKFHQLVYEVESEYLNFHYDMPYHEFFKEDFIVSVSEKLGNKMYNEIEPYLKKH